MSANSAAEALYYKRQLDDLKRIGEKAALYEKVLKTTEVYQNRCRDLYNHNCSLASENFDLREEIARLRKYIAATVPRSTGTTPMIEYTY